MRGFTTGVIVVAGMLLSLQGAAAQANPLKELVSVRGTSTIQYERAVGKRAEFARLAADGATAGVAVTVVDDGGTGAGAKVAEGYLEGLRTVLPQSALLAASDSASPQFVARIALSAREGRAGETSKMIYGAQGTSCQQGQGRDEMRGGRLGAQCHGQDRRDLDQPGAHGDDPRVPARSGGQRGRTGGGVRGPVHGGLRASECSDPGAAAASVARLLGATALSSRAVNIDFPTSTRLLGCNAKR